MFPKSFSKKLRESIIPYSYPIYRAKIAEELYADIINFRYHPLTPRDYIVINKGNHVTRLSPTFHAKDYFLYYFCTKILEDEIAINHVEGTFGGWRLGNQIRIREEGDELQVTESAPSNSYNPFLWTEQWGEFQKRAFEANDPDQYPWIVKLDIANFYDNINLDLLKKKLYLNAPRNKLFYIDLLIHFLSNWNKKFEGYANKSVGLPQDELSDSSRLLANFYLQDFDNEIKNICDSVGAKYLRYADDKLIYAKSKKDAEYLVYEASKNLSRIGLNINTGKVKYFDNPETFNQYWSFEIHELLGDKTNAAKINEGIRKYIEWKDKGIEFKEFSVLKVILNRNFAFFETALKHKVLSYLFEKDFISILSNWAMNKVYNQLSTEDKDEFLRITWELVDECNFNFYHYNLMKFYDKNRITYDKMYVQRRIQNLKI